MNYSSYKSKIIKKFGVTLTEWPIYGCVHNSGELGQDDAIILRHALVTKECKWIKLSAQQWEAQRDTTNSEGNDREMEQEVF